MIRFLSVVIGAASLAGLFASVPDSIAASAAGTAQAGAASAGRASAAQIVERNVAARGGLQAWRTVSTLTLSGLMEAGGKKNTALPFVMTLKRPHKSRFEVRFNGQTAFQVYDGAQGWKVRPFLGRDEVEPYTPAEAKSAAQSAELDGPLIDYASKGSTVQLTGSEMVEGHRAYVLKVTTKERVERRVWIDAATYLELKIDGDPRVLDGRTHRVSVFFRDFRKEGGLVVPHTLETAVAGVKGTHKLTIDHVAVNQPVDDTSFGKPQLGAARVTSR
ncbi:outer membrane lipoprotein-sorting protein [Burkholderia sp. BCC1977]|uniref:outer membrane lipoprotein-sorting protein n=1 Tax=Burkholderia sp. BCC1977 TaxID=2817440 RepID=UPI002ABE3891|nr:outer membrane lipoprotein-sorting protein [Burkholderia sp. BCC1977]